jgi:CRP/FNR family transcriptional regulator, cyclic AMP receptor protein
MAAPAQPAQIIPQAQPSSHRSPSRLTRTGPARPQAPDPRVSMCKVLREDPELAAAVPEPRRQEALDRCTAPEMTISAPASVRSAVLEVGGGFGLLILGGVLVRRVWIDGRSSAEILGRGDLFGPIVGSEEAILPVQCGWSILEPLRVAALGTDFVAHHVKRYPELAPALTARAAQRSQNLAVNLAIVSQPRVDARVHVLLWHLAERWGRVRADGVVLPLRLTHALLAELVGARRPSVSGALARLADRGLIRRSGGTWLLLGEPPGDGTALGVLHTGNGQQHAHAGDHCR